MERIKLTSFKKVERLAYDMMLMHDDGIIDTGINEYIPEGKSIKSNIESSSITSGTPVSIKRKK